MKIQDYVLIYPPIVRHAHFFQTPHQILKEFSQRGVRSIFCDVAQDYNKDKWLQQSDYGFEICYNFNELKRKLGKQKIIFYNTLPKSHSVNSDLNTSAYIFHYLDDFKEWEKDLKTVCDKADMILCVADKLCDKIYSLEETFKNKTYLLNNACDFNLFKIYKPGRNLNKSFLKIKNEKKPIVLYYGCTHSYWFDLQLMKNVIRKMKDTNFVFIGQELECGFKEFNYTYIPHIEVKNLPEYLHQSDVCIIPFLKNNISISVDPLKMYEFFAAGKPIVATSHMPEVNKHQKLLYYGDTEKEFCEGIKKALNEKGDALKLQRIKTAGNNSWEKRVDVLQELIEEKLFNKSRKKTIVKKEKQNVRIEKIKNPLISVVLPVYNQEKYIRASIDSILNQTYKNIELIIVDDGSTDKTKEILKEYYNHPKVIVIHQINKKLPAALNTGFRQAKGEFLTWTSSDNISLPEQYEKLLNYLQEENNFDKGMVYSNYYLIDDKGDYLLDTNFRCWNRTDPKDKSKVILPKEVTEKNFCDTKDNFIGASFLYRKEIAEQVGEYNEKYFGAEDLDYWLRMRRVTEIGHIKDFLYLYRVHPDSLNSNHRELGIMNTNEIVREEDRKIREEIKKKKESSDVVVKSKIPIAITIPTFGTGGMEQTTNNIVCGLDKNKFDVTLMITCEDEKKAGNIPPDIKKYNIPTVILDENIDKLKRIINNKKFKLINAHHSLFGLDEYNKQEIKVLYTIHNIYSWVDPSPEYLKIDRFIAVSEACRQYFSPRFNIPLEKIVTVPNGLDTDNIQGEKISRKELRCKEDDYLFVNVGSITKVKMQHFQLNALASIAKEIPNIKIIFVGSILEPVYYNDLKIFIKNNDLQNNVIFRENQTRSQVAGLLQTADCFLLPSLIEGWSNAVMEAMYWEKPLILTEIGNARDVIKNGDIGIIVPNPYGDSQNLTPQLHYQYCHGGIKPDIYYLKNAMIYMYNNKDYFKQQGKLGKKKIEEKYMLKHMVADYEKEFENALH
jgi:glycosyltransferase involved in cell wall biosynthesis